jgi:hypothetical protein
MVFLLGGFAPAKAYIFLRAILSGYRYSLWGIFGLKAVPMLLKIIEGVGVLLFVGLCAYWGYTSNRNKIF